MANDLAYPRPNPVSVDRSYPRWRAIQRDLDRYFDECWHSSTAQRFSSERRRGAYCAGVAWKIARNSGRYNDYPAFHRSAAENPITSGGSGMETTILVLGGLTALGAIGYAIYKATQSAPTFAPVLPIQTHGPLTITPNESIQTPPHPLLSIPPPTNVIAKAGSGLAVLSWTPPSNSASITGYTAVSTPGGLTVSAAANETGAIVRGLTNGTSYTFTVTSTDASGPGQPSAPSNAITPSASWHPLSPNASQGLTFTLGPTYRLSFPTTLGKSFQTIAQGLLNQGFTMVMSYDQGAVLPSDWPSSDNEPARFRYTVAVDASSHSTVDIAAVDIPAGLRVFQLS